MSLDAALVGSAALMGLAASPHCALMCGTPCALAARGRREQRRLLAGRLIGYALAGTLAAASMQLLTRVSGSAPMLQHLWALLQAALLALGLGLAVVGRMPAWLGNAHWRPGPGRSFTTGLSWTAMPCGALHAALLLAALCDSPLGGGVAMAAFAATSTLGLAVAPAMAAFLRRRVGNGALAVRLGGAAMAASAAWALVHGVWQRAALAC